MTNRDNIASGAPIRPTSLLQHIVLFCVVAILSYLCSKLGGVLVLRPEMIWPVWPGCAFLVAVLLVTPRRYWRVLLLIGLAAFALYDLQEALPVRAIVLLLLADCIEIVVAVAGVHYVLGSLPRLNSVRALAKYSIFAVILAPVSVASVASSALENDSWWVSFFNEALALLTWTPAILSGVDFALKRIKRSKGYYLEMVSMWAGVGVVAYLTFAVSGSGGRPALLYSLVPFLLWAALRFGIYGTSTSLVLVSLVAIWGAIHARGPFTGSSTVHNVLALQLFLLVAASSFMVLAALSEESKAAEASVRESERRFRSVADTAPVLIWTSGTDRLCTYFNQPWLDFTGRSLEQELGNGWAEGVHAEDLSRCLDTYTQCFDRREKFRMEYRLRRHDGEFRWILDIGVPRFGDDRSFAGYIGIAIDVTERKEAERALSESEERLRLATQAARMFAYSWDAATDLIVRSGESREILGLSAEEAPTGTAISAMVHPADKERLESALATLTPETPTLHITYRFMRSDGAIIWLDRNSRAYFDSNRNLKRIVGMIVDVTERKKAEQSLADLTRKLIEAQELERARIGRELHDDITQRLALLVVEIEELREEPSDIEQRLQRIRDKTIELATDVQSLSHELHSPKLNYVGAIESISNWCREFAERQKLEIAFKAEVPDDLPHEIGLCLMRVLQEALHNAVKHSGAKRVEVEIAEHSNAIHLLINDSGVGFDLETVVHGGGLGLTSMQERVQLVNGTISIRSKPMSGTTIHVQLPISHSSTE